MSYRVGNLPPDVPRAVADELRKVEQAWASAVPFLILDTISVAPKKTPEGMLVKADGVAWNPGSGAGVYCFRAGAWRFLG